MAQYISRSQTLGLVVRDINNKLPLLDIDIWKNCAGMSLCE